LRFAISNWSQWVQMSYSAGNRLIYLIYVK
jgi:hypothetical protein